MHFLKSKYLNDGRLFNDGRPVDLIQNLPNLSSHSPD
jgi:hypothetical protein